MLLASRRWGPRDAGQVVCVHGIGQRGSVFEPLAERLVAAGHGVLAVDLRGHGESGREPPWNTDTHVRDLLETADDLGVERATWIGHSFGGRLVAALGAVAPERTERLALLDPGLGVPPERALRGAEIERLDWSFVTVEGAVNALLSTEAMVAPPVGVVTAYAESDVQRGPDGRYRFSFSPAAAVVAWSEVALPPPPVAAVPTLVVRAEAGTIDPAALRARYSGQLGEMLSVVTVPNGHNVLWESPQETIAAIERFLSQPPSQVGSAEQQADV